MTKKKENFMIASPYIVMVLTYLGDLYLNNDKEADGNFSNFSLYVFIAIAIIYTAFIIFKFSNRKSVKKLSTSYHSARDYNKTKAFFSSEIEKSTVEVPDIYLTSFGNNYKNLKKCNGFNDYQNFLYQISSSNQCVLHRYHIINDESQLQHVQDIIERNKGNSNCNIYIQIVKSLGIYDDVFLNFAVIDDSFAALTFENDSKIILSFNYTDLPDVQMIKDIVKSFSTKLLCVLKSGNEMTNNIDILKNSLK